MHQLTSGETVTIKQEPGHALSGKSMKPLLFIANAFINTFGITQPSERAARQAAWFIAVLLLLVLGTVGAVAVLVLHGIYRH